MSSNLQNSIWPNEGGTLGQIKVQIPDGVNTFWPEGDALVGNFVYKDGKLAGLVDTKALTINDSKSTIIDYDYFDTELPFTEGEITITRGPRSKYFNVRYSVSNDDDVVITLKYKGCKTLDDIKAVDPNYLTNDIIDGVWKEGLGDLEQGDYGDNNGGMFYCCNALTTFTSDLSSLKNANRMFGNCSNLDSFSSELPSLTNGESMFSGCYNLTTFNSNLSSLTNGYEMFANCALTSWNINLSSLTNGWSMFRNCPLTSWNIDLSSLTDGVGMFEFCVALESFNSDLSSLTNGSYMFGDCKLDTASIQNIADTIKDVNGLISDCLEGIYTKIDIGIGNSEPNEQEEAAFNTIASKGWTVYVNGNQFSSCSSCCATCCASLTTLDETDGEFVAPKPYWAKPVPSDEKHAHYVDSEGNFFNILGAQFIYGDDLSTYGMFTSLEDAAAQMRLKKIGEEEMEIETA